MNGQLKESLMKDHHTWLSCINTTTNEDRLLKSSLLVIALRRSVVVWLKHCRRDPEAKGSSPGFRHDLSQSDGKEGLGTT